MRRCVALRLHESWEAAGWTTTPYYAGHVLGAAMMHARFPGGYSIVYTGMLLTLLITSLNEYVETLHAQLV